MRFYRIFLTSSFLLIILPFGFVNAIQCVGNPNDTTLFPESIRKQCFEEAKKYLNALLPSELKTNSLTPKSINIINTHWLSPADLNHNKQYINNVKKEGKESIEKKKIDLNYYINDKKNKEKQLGPRWVFRAHDSKIRKICKDLIALGDSDPKCPGNNNQRRGRGSGRR